MPFEPVESVFSVEVAGKTDVGCVRTNNEDSFGYDATRGVYVLCDGMGGQAAGEVASELSVTTVLSCFSRSSSVAACAVLDPADGLSDNALALGSALQAANQAIREAIAADSRHEGMGTTIVAALLQGSNLAIAHAGDSRIYLIRNHSIEQLTKDHSLVMEQVRRGFITLEEAAHSPNQNIITRALGASELVEPDLADYELIAGDTLLLCSDGLTRHLTDERILMIAEHAPSLEAACSALIDAAKVAGGSDNVTCLLIRVS